MSRARDGRPRAFMSPSASDTSATPTRCFEVLGSDGFLVREACFLELAADAVDESKHTQRIAQLRPAGATKLVDSCDGFGK